MKSKLIFVVYILLPTLLNMCSTPSSEIESFSIENEGILKGFDARNLEPIDTYKVGDIDASYAVDENGSFSYSIPIKVIPGRVGMEPKLSISYNNNIPNGFLGVGWQLGGVSSIIRVRSAKAVGDKIDPLDFDEHDRFNLDGEPLIAVDGNYHDDQTEYFTEQRNFSKIVGIGSNRLLTKNFIVKTKSGLTMNYGDLNGSSYGISEDSVVIYSVNKIKDTNDNNIQFFYDNDNQHLISKISYTHHKAGSAFAEVRFNWMDRTDKEKTFVYGQESIYSKLLESIEVIYTGGNSEEMFRKYVFKYSQDKISLLSKLESITEFGRDKAKKIPSFFEWEDTESEVKLFKKSEFETSISLDKKMTSTLMENLT